MVTSTGARSPGPDGPPRGDPLAQSSAVPHDPAVPDDPAVPENPAVPEDPTASRDAATREPRGGRGVVVRGAQEIARGLGRSHPDSDLALWAAGATFFGLIGIVPIVLVSLRLAAALVGPDVLAQGVATAVAGIPQGHGAPEALRVLTATALRMSPLQTAVVLFPASLYGEGLRRAFLQLSPERPNRFTGWQGRLALLPVVAIAPVLVLALLAAGPVVAPLYLAGGRSLILGVVIAFHVTFVLLSVALGLIYRLVGGRIGIRALLLGSASTGAFVAGFLQGFLLFLAIPVDWSLPFGGLPVFGAVAALALWLYLIHVLVLVGYRLTLTLDGPWSGYPS
jgi:membrane protein